MNPRILAAREVVARANLEHARAVAEAQMVCKHTNCAEADYVPSNYFNATPPLGICLDCGMTEQGWAYYYGLHGLRGKYNGVSRIDRNELYRMRAGLYLDDEKKTKLARREESLCTLIAAWVAMYSIAVALPETEGA